MKISSTRKIKAPKDQLWTILGDFSNIYRFHPMLKDSNFIEGSTSCEVGTTRQCDFKDGKNYLKERVTEWEEGSHYTIEIYDSSMPIKDASASIGLRRIDEETTEAYMDVEMKVTNPLMVPIMYAMYKFQGVPSILKGLEDQHKKDFSVQFA